MKTSTIYVYQERTGRRRWYVGKTIHPERRDKQHRALEGNNPYFHNFIKKAYENGFEFDDALERFVLAVVPEINASDVECFYTDKLKALAPDGFVLQKGSGGGTRSEITKKQISHSLRNFSEEKQTKKSAKARATRAVTTKRNREKRRIEKMLAELDGAHERQKKAMNPKLKGVEFVTNLIIKANRPMKESEVANEMRKNGQASNSAAATLMRAAGYSSDTLTYLGNRGTGKMKFIQKIERIEIEPGSYEFRPLPEFAMTKIERKTISRPINFF